MDCVLFDLDGTVADTEVLKAKALSLAVQSFGRKVSPEIYKRVMGQSWETVTSTFFDAADVEVLLEDFNPIFRKFYEQLIADELMETRSISRFVAFLKLRKFSLGLVSSASPWMIEKTLTKLRLIQSFDVVISNVDTQRHKPHPDAYLLALERLAVKTSATIVFEDSESGFKAATAAGLDVYGIKHAFNESHDFSLCKGIVSTFEECLSWDVF